MTSGSSVTLPHQTSVRLSVPFHDVDPLGVVWHGHYFKYLEIARTAMLHPLGLDGEPLIATGHRLYVIDSRCRHTAPLRYRDDLRVVAWLREWEHRLDVAYEIHNETTGRRAARAHTVLAFTDAADNLLFDVPELFRQRLQPGG